MVDQSERKNIQTVEVNLNSEKTQKKTIGQAEVLVWDKAMAKKKAMVGLWICWGLALLTIPIPIVHFVSVPFLVIAGPIAAYAVYKLHVGSSDILSSKGVCPDCGGQVLLEKKTASWPISMPCPQCQAALQATRL